MFHTLRNIATRYLSDHGRGYVLSYAVFCAELLAQFDRILGYGLRVELTDVDPFKTSADLFADIEANGRLLIYSAADLPAEHPMSQVATDYRDCNGRSLTFNHIFRACHDYFGHYSGENSFSARGEIAAFRVHGAMFPRLALPALAAETVCQVAVFYSRPELWRPDGTLPRPGDADFLPLPKREFSPQIPAVSAGKYAADILLNRGALRATIGERNAYGQTTAAPIGAHVASDATAIVS